MTRDGVPLCHHVFPGNTVDKSTVVDVVRDIKSRFHLRNVIFVGDRGMLSDENLETILDEELGFIVAHPLRRSTIAAEVIAKLGKKFDRTKEEEQFKADERTSLRFVLAYSPQIARRSRKSARLASPARTHSLPTACASSQIPLVADGRRLRRGPTTGSGIICGTIIFCPSTTSTLSTEKSSSAPTRRPALGRRRSTGCFCWRRQT